MTTFEAHKILHDQIEDLLVTSTITEPLAVLKLTFIKDILDMFHQYPTLHSISINTETIIKLKDTFEGVSELSIINMEQIAWDSVDNIKATDNYQVYIKKHQNTFFSDYLDSYLDERKELPFIPYYNNSNSDDLRNKNLLPYNIEINDSHIRYNTLHNIEMHLHDNFYYLADSAQQSYDFVKDYEKNYNDNLITFKTYTQDGNINLNFIDEINMFLGKELNAILFHHALQKKIPISNYSVKNNKIKI